jgi:ferredoxin
MAGYEVPRADERRPHYEGERRGSIARVDERDALFARADLFREFPEGSPQRDEYYTAHPEARALDETIAGMPRIGSRGGDYAPICDGLFDSIRAISMDAAVAGTGLRGPTSPSAQNGHGLGAGRPTPGGEDPGAGDRGREALPPEEASARIKSIARTLGADLVGTGPLRPEWVYSHVGRSYGDAEGFEPWGRSIDLSGHPNAIALVFSMDRDFLAAAPEFPTVLATGAAYAASAVAAVRLAAIIRGMGYSARAHHVYNYRVLAVPVAVDCGLGELSRAGFLLTKELGLGLRLSVVTTDMPLRHDSPADIGVQAFCSRCLVCAENCPAGAIPKGKKAEFNGVMKWKLDAEKCYRYWYTVSTDCALCMSTCPWTNTGTWIHRILARLAMVKGRRAGLSSLRPMRLRSQMAAMGVTLAGLTVAAIWWAASGGLRATARAAQTAGDPGAGAGALGPAGWAVYLVWLAWTLLGIAVVWTFAAERSFRAALLSLAVLGLVSALAGLLLF